MSEGIDISFIISSNTHNKLDMYEVQHKAQVLNYIKLNNSDGILDIDVTNNTRLIIYKGGMCNYTTYLDTVDINSDDIYKMFQIFIQSVKSLDLGIEYKSVVSIFISNTDKINYDVKEIVNNFAHLIFKNPKLSNMCIQNMKNTYSQYIEEQLSFLF